MDYKVMDYKEFKEELLEELRGFYGDSAEVYAERMQKNNGRNYDGLRIVMKGKSPSVTPVIVLDEIHDEHLRRGMDVESCAKGVVRTLQDCSVPESVEQFAARVDDWDFVKDKTYPILLSTEDNRELLQKLVSRPMLDLSVAYIIRVPMEGGCSGSIKITRKLLDMYGISAGQLHSQAMENLRGDGYEFQDICSVVQGMLTPEELDGTHIEKNMVEGMYVLTNPCRTYGAAGILDRELVKGFAGERDYYILPSSIHETIFVPTNGIRQEEFDSLVAQINQAEVSPEERLVNHSYYYHARTGEIRMYF